MKDLVYLGSTPPEESCAQMGFSGYEVRVAQECERYIKRIRSFLGNEPVGAKLKVLWQDHDLGSYAEVVCEFDTDNKEAMEYAFRCEGDGPLTWDED